MDGCLDKRLHIRGQRGIAQIRGGRGTGEMTVTVSVGISARLRQQLAMVRASAARSR